MSQVRGRAQPHVAYVQKSSPLYSRKMRQAVASYPPTSLIHNQDQEEIDRQRDSSNNYAGSRRSSQRKSYNRGMPFLLGDSVRNISSPKKTLFKVVLVRLVAGEKPFDTFAFLDSVSDTTFIRQDVAKTKLDLGKLKTKWLVKTYDGTAKEVERSRFHTINT